jgi:hypothetical protein
VSKTAQVLALLREPSTWSGLAVLAVLAGMTIEQFQAIANAGAAVAAAVSVLKREGPSR